MQKKLIILTLIISSIISITAQIKDTLVILPGNEKINGSFIENYTNKWEVTFTTADGKKSFFRIWTDYMQMMELKEKVYLHRVQDIYDPNGNLLDTWTNFTEKKTLIPSTAATNTPKGNFTFFKFEGNKITGNKFTPKDSTKTDVKETLSINVFDWSLYGILLVGLPFEKGLIAKLPIYDDNSETKFSWLIAEIQEKETVPADKNTTRETWKLKTNKGLTFWLSKEIPYVIKLKLDLANGGHILWEMM